MSVVTNLIFHRGCDIALTVDINEAIDGWTFTWLLKTAIDGEVLFTLTMGLGVSITDATAGLVLINISEVITSLARGDYYWVLCRSDTGAKDVVARGRFSLQDPEAV